MSVCPAVCPSHAGILSKHTVTIYSLFDITTPTEVYRAYKSIFDLE